MRIPMIAVAAGAGLLAGCGSPGPAVPKGVSTEQAPNPGVAPPPTPPPAKQVRLTDSKTDDPPPPK